MTVQPTSRRDIIVVVWLVDSLNLSTNVEFLGHVVEVLDSRMVHIATKNVLALLLPNLEKFNPRQQDPHTTYQPLAPHFPERHLSTSIGENGLGGIPKKCPNSTFGSKDQIVTCQDPGENSLVRAIDIINGQNSQITIVPEVTEGKTRASLKLGAGDE